MIVESLGEIIAERRVYLQAQGVERREIIVRVGKPRPFPHPPEDYYVPYELVGIKRDGLRYAAGVDAVQALQLVMRMIGDDLHAIARAHHVTISWVAGSEGDSGFPTTVSAK